MDFYNCPYVVVIPFRNGNEYDEDYGCGATGKSCQCCQCKLTPVECEQLFRNLCWTYVLRNEIIYEKNEKDWISE